MVAIDCSSLELSFEVVSHNFSNLVRVVRLLSVVSCILLIIGRWSESSSSIVSQVRDSLKLLVNVKSSMSPRPSDM